MLTLAFGKPEKMSVFCSIITFVEMYQDMAKSRDTFRVIEGHVILKSGRPNTVFMWKHILKQTLESDETFKVDRISNQV